jgi:PRC-barrel domain
MVQTFTAIVLGVALAASACHAQAVFADPVLGAPVFAADGVKVGEVTDASTDESGKIDFLRVTTGVRLGLGERQVIIPRPVFMIRGKTVSLPRPPRTSRHCRMPLPILAI